MHLGLDALAHDLRRIVAVEAAEFAVDEVVEVFDGIFDLRCEQVVRHGPQCLAAVGNEVRIFHDDLIGLLLAEIGEFLQHFVGRLKIDGQRFVRVLHLLGGEQDVAVDFVLWVEEVDVAGGADGLAQLFAELDDRAVEAAQLLLAFGHAFFQHEAVVADGLDLEEIVERGDALQLRPAFVRDDGLEQLARLAG